MIIESPNVYINNNGINGNIIFDTTNKSIIINSLPSGIISSDLTSNITLNVPLIINRSFNNHSQYI